MDDADWDAAVAQLAWSAREIQILGRCLDVGEPLTAWRTGSDLLPGTLASDALDQALGLLDELAAGRAASLANTLRRLLDVLPPSLD